VKFGSRRFNNVVAAEVDDNFVRNVTLGIYETQASELKELLQVEKGVGSIGRGLVGGTNILLDSQSRAF
jgi:hypothetical protein